MANKYVNPLDPPYVPPADADTDTATQSPSPAPSEPVSASVSTPNSSSTVTVAIPSDDDISTMAELLSALSPADIDRLRLASSANPDLSLMLAVSNGDSNIKRLPDGSIQATITLSPDLISMLEPWAEAAGQTIGQQIQELAEVALSAYMNMDWQAHVVSPAPPVAAAAVTPPVPVVVPPAVAK